MKLLIKADEIANDYHSAASTKDRDQLKVDWYAEVKRVAEIIQMHAASRKKLTERRKKRAARG